MSYPFPAPVVCPPAPGAPTPFSDALTAPTGEALLPAVIAQTPRGPAWRTDEMADAELPSAPVSVQHSFWRAVCDPLADLYAKLWKLALASTACTLSGPEDPANDALEDWENDWGLPDPCTAYESFSVAQRKTILRSKIADQGGQSIAYFYCLAASIGFAQQWTADSYVDLGGVFLSSRNVQTRYLISIDEFEPFRCGRGRCGHSPVGFAWNEVIWRVTVSTPSVAYFRCGQGQCGVTPLGSFGRRRDLECLFKQWRPGHTQIVFRYRFLGGADCRRAGTCGGLFPPLLLG